MEIKVSNHSDFDEIFRLYSLATAYQKTKFNSYWPEFEDALVKKEINDKRQWKLVDQDKIVLVWATAFSDPLIWEERDKDPALYLHRIAVNPEYRGQKMIQVCIDWAINHAKSHQMKSLRMDTVGENKKLIAYYKSCGFEFLGLSKLNQTTGLPTHYHNAVVSLFEIKF